MIFYCYETAEDIRQPLKNYLLIDVEMGISGVTTPAKEMQGGKWTAPHGMACISACLRDLSKVSRVILLVGIAVLGVSGGIYDSYHIHIPIYHSKPPT
jgi:hypothetical protein